MSADPLAETRLAALGLDVTTGRPPLITEASVLHLDGGMITAGPWTWQVQPDAPACEVRPALRTDLWLAPAWDEVAGRVVEQLFGRALIVHDVGRWAVLRAHLPDWQPPAVVFTRRLAQTVWPGLAGYDLPALAQRAGITQTTGTSIGARAEAHAAALLLLSLTRATGRLPLHGEHTTNGD